MAEAPIFECVVSADLFRRAGAALYTDELRYYLRGVHVEPCADGGAALVSTDGHRLIALRDGGAIVNGKGTVSLSATMVKALTFKQKRGGPERRRVVAVRGNRAAVVEFVVSKDKAPDYSEALDCVDRPNADVVAYQWCDVIIDGAFPEWRKVIGKPLPQPAAVGAVDIAKLSSLVAALVPEKQTLAFQLWPTDGGAVQVVPYYPGDFDGLAIVMPLRDGRRSPLVPSWATPAAQAEAA